MQAEVSTSSGSTVARRARGVTTLLQALLLADARREMGTSRWTKTMRSYSPRMTTRTTRMVEASEAAVVEGRESARRGSSGGRNT